MAAELSMVLLSGEQLTDTDNINRYMSKYVLFKL